MNELSLTTDQIERLDEIDNAAHKYLKVLVNDPELNWNMEYIGELNDMAAEFMHKEGFKIYYPAIKTNNDGIQKRVDYYEPDKMMNGTIINGAYWSIDRFNKFEGQMPEGFNQYTAQLNDRKTGDITIWARSQKEAMEIADSFTEDERKTFVAWFHVEQTVDMNVPKLGQTAEHPMRPVTLILRDQDGLNVVLHVINIETPLPDNAIIPAIKAACQDYLNTPEGRRMWENNGNNFNYGDFDLYVSNEFCIPHGFYHITSYVPDIIEDDFNITLAKPEDK